MYREPSGFFRNAHPTAVTAKLFRNVFGSLSSADEGGAAARLSPDFCGGTTLTIAGRNASLPKSNTAPLCR